jgi:phage terminase large subunit GpA-like protein
MIDVTKDKHPHKVMRKSAQATASEIILSLGLAVADKLGLNTVYAMPAMSQMQLFSHGRVQRAIMMSPKIRDKVTGVTNVSQKEIGQGILYLIGSQDYRQLISIDADLLVIDEVDGHLQENIPVLEQRIEHSNLKWRMYVSTPTLPEYGIDQMYQESDQREWFIKCDHCNELQTLTWEANVVELPEPMVVCRKCRKPINRLADGEWVAKYPSRSDDCHGYYVNKLFCERAVIKQLMKRSKSRRHRAQFYNSDLGLPYVPEGGKIHRDEIFAIAELPEPPNHPESGWLTIAGVDVGPQELYVGIDRVMTNGARQAILRKKIENCGIEAFEELRKLFVKWRVRCAVLDAQPETRLVKQFVERKWGRGAAMYRCYFRPIDKEYRLNRPERIVNANRTMCCDGMTEVFRSGEGLKLPRSFTDNPDYLEHLQAPVRITVDQNVKGVAIEREARDAKTIYAKTHKPDHFFFVEVYLWLAADIAPHPVRTILGKPF